MLFRILFMIIGIAVLPKIFRLIFAVIMFIRSYLYYVFFEKNKIK